MAVKNYPSPWVLSFSSYVIAYLMLGGLDGCLFEVAETHPYFMIHACILS